MSWKAYLYQVTSGRIGPQIDLASASWDITINTVETLHADIKKNSIPADTVNEFWLEPWWGGIILLWNKIPIFAGPITGAPTEGFTTISVDCSGIRSILARREVISEQSDWNKLAASVISYKGLSLGTIAKRIVQVAQQKPGGSLPISYATPDQTIADDADHVRTYNGFDVANLDCDAVLTKLSNAQNGPDIMFKPKLLNDASLTFDLWTGNEQDPYIFQNNTLYIDTTVVDGEATDVSIAATAGYKTNRVFGTGAGSDAGTLIAVAENLDTTRLGYPLLETVVTGSLETYAGVLNTATGNLNANLNTLKELSLSLRTNGIFPLGSYWVGDSMNIYLQGWRSFDDGIHKVRLLQMSGTLENTVKLSFQKTQD